MSLGFLSDGYAKHGLLDCRSVIVQRARIVA
jgi:hypothetical protein